LTDRDPLNYYPKIAPNARETHANKKRHLSPLFSGVVTSNFWAFGIDVYTLLPRVRFV
jgi:hypothetical protein